MLKIRLSTQGRKKLPFFRIVLTEHTKPVHAGFKDVLGTYHAANHELEYDLDTIKQWVKKGASVSSRLAKLLFKDSKDEVFSKFIVYSDRKRKKKNADE